MTGLDVSRNNLYMYVYSIETYALVCVCVFAKRLRNGSRPRHWFRLFGFIRIIFPSIGTWTKISQNKYIDIHNGCEFAVFIFPPLVGYLRYVAVRSILPSVAASESSRRRRFPFVRRSLSLSSSSLPHPRRVLRGRRRPRITSNEIGHFSL